MAEQLNTPRFDLSASVPSWATAPPPASEKALASSYAKALMAENTPVEISVPDRSGFFSGRHGQYTATLDGCPCGNRVKPCKHMYRLAMELGLLPAPYINDQTKIKYPKSTSVGFLGAVSMLEKASEDAQHELYLLIDCLKDASTAHGAGLDDAAADELTACGVLVRLDDPPCYILSPAMRDNFTLVKRYLLRKFGVNAYMDLAGNIYNIPYGSIPSADFSVVVWPRDTVTAALAERGHDRCAAWNREHAAT